MSHNMQTTHSTLTNRQGVKKRVLLGTQLASIALISALSMPPVFDVAHAVVPTTRAVAMQNLPSSFADLVEKVRPAVVTVATTQKADQFWHEFRRHPAPKDSPFEFFPKDSPFDDFFRRFFERESFQLNRDVPQQRPKKSGLGSGFIIDADGFIVTNHHVIEGAEEITVTLNDGNEYSATVVGDDAKTDLALLKIEANRPLPYITFGNSDKARVGDWVIAVGNPFGFGGTFTAGIISARGRDIQSGPYDDFIQVDASINRGNSGGPLLNLDGEVIGVNTAIYSPTGGNVGIGFAVPSSMAKPIIKQLRKHGSVERGWLGVQIQSVTKDIAESLGMANAKGALVVKVLPDTPAQKARILQGDVIFEVNGKTVKSAKALSRMIANAAVGKPVRLSVWRQGSKKIISVRLGRMAAEEPATLSRRGGQSSTDVLGLTLAKITKQTRQQYQLSEDVEGVVIVDVESGSPAAKKGLQVGDVIVTVNQQKVAMPDEVVEKVKQAVKANRRTVLLFIDRQGTQLFMAVKIR
jgi:serine protease Do